MDTSKEAMWDRLWQTRARYVSNLIGVESDLESIREDVNNLAENIEGYSKSELMRHREEEEWLHTKKRRVEP